MSDDKKIADSSTGAATDQLSTNDTEKTSVKNASAKKPKKQTVDADSKKAAPKTKKASEKDISSKKSTDSNFKKSAKTVKISSEDDNSASSQVTRQKAKALKERVSSSLSETRKKATSAKSSDTTKKAKSASTSRKKKNELLTEVTNDQSANRESGARTTPTATNEAAKDSAVWYNPLSSSIFSKPIFSYQDEAQKPEDTPSLQSDDPIEIRDESLEMLLDLQFDDEDSNFEFSEHAEQSGLIPLDIFGTASADVNQPIPEDLLIAEEVSEMISNLKADDMQSLIEEDVEDSAQSDDFSYNANTKSNDIAIQGEEENFTPEDETIEPQIPELPPLMDIDHFSDYHSKYESESQEEDQLSFITEENEDEHSDQIEIENSSAESTVSNTEINETVDTDSSDFQRSFFEGTNQSEITNISGQQSDKKRLVAEAYSIPDEKSFDPEKPRKIDFRFDFIELFVFTLVVIMILTTFVFRHSIVDGSSMEGTLQNGDHLIIYDLFYTPKNGDIIVFEDYSTEHIKPLVKRVIATEGQTVKIDVFGDVYVDGVMLDEDYVYLDGYDSITKPLECTVPEGEVFVMGDHRNSSSDSRSFGTVKVDSILGKAILRFLPFSSFGTIE